MERFDGVGDRATCRNKHFSGLGRGAEGAVRRVGGELEMKKDGEAAVARAPLCCKKTNYKAKTSSDLKVKSVEEHVVMSCRYEKEESADVEILWEREKSVEKW